MKAQKRQNIQAHLKTEFVMATCPVRATHSHLARVTRTALRKTSFVAAVAADCKSWPESYPCLGPCCPYFPSNRRLGISLWSFSAVVVVGAARVAESCRRTCPAGERGRRLAFQEGTTVSGRSTSAAGGAVGSVAAAAGGIGDVVAVGGPCSGLGSFDEKSYRLENA